MEQTNISQTNPSSQGFNFKDFLSFRTMITLTIMQILYGVGAALITLFGLISMFRSNSEYGSYLPGGFFAGLLIIIIGNVFWRVWCEIIIVLFRINKTLTNIDANTKK
jgi:hypothetical protein